ncbi:M23 family metallopeptidase [Candidatus Gromoviella agglomerans]|uniref:M23 family metallopeptidase n=1 Tax=Candidatus Gromoviella agglomerans TaxID=2806609 RepID=UPI001E5C1193|nr:M23 family metallopeptidase [Candidatus Gromoviella agglomerans]UFX98191.1 M23 family metallopeptidase [Candidatus Gromoviella agglomerans]
MQMIKEYILKYKLHLSSFLAFFLSSCLMFYTYDGPVNVHEDLFAENAAISNSQTCLDLISLRKEESISSINEPKYKKPIISKKILSKSENSTHKYKISSFTASIKGLENELAKFFKQNIALPQWLISNLASSKDYSIANCHCCNKFVIFINGADYSVHVKSSNGSKYPYIFEKRKLARNFYLRSIEVNGNFIQSCRKIGLSHGESINLVRVLRGLFNIKSIDGSKITGKLALYCTSYADGDIKFENKSFPFLVQFTSNEKVISLYSYNNSMSKCTFYDKYGKCIVFEGLVAPMKNFRINSLFGYRIHPVYGVRKFHAGIDLQSSTGSEILSMGYGTVVKKGFIGGFGNCVFIKDHRSGKVFRYAHLQSFANNIFEGGVVDMNQPIGIMGKTGTASGPHLHLEIRNGQIAENPLSILNELSQALKGTSFRDFKLMLSELRIYNDNCR